MKLKGFHIPASKVKALSGYAVDSMKDIEALEKLGVFIAPRAMELIGTAHRSMALDSALVGNLTTPNGGIPMRFLQQIMPGFVEVITQARNADELIGITTVGRWEDREVVQPVSERSGKGRLYSDNANVPLTNWNINYEPATIVRFEQGLSVGALGAAHASAMGYSDAEAKRAAAAIELEIIRNMIAWYGFNDGNGRTYGILNAPGLPAYDTAPTGASGDTTWTRKTTLEIINDILVTISALRTKSGDIIDPKKVPLTLGLPTSRIDMLTKPTELGYSIKHWLQENYPNIRLVSAPEFQEANGTENVMYLFADNVPGSGSDNGRVIDQIVPAKFVMLGVENGAKSYTEDYTNATAGVMCKRPYAVQRVTGI